MAHSTQAQHGRYATFNDRDLMVVISLAGEVVATRADRGPTVAAWLARRKSDAEGYGTGCIDLRLDEIDGTGKHELIALLDAVDELSSSFGNLIPAAALEPLCPFHGVRFSDYPVKLVRGAIEKLRRFVASP